jgi:hypothetical protein
MEQPLLVLSGATTGLPRGGYEPKLLEAAAVLVLPGGPGGLTVAGPTNGRWSSLIYQPSQVLNDPKSFSAAGIHNIGTEESLSAPTEAEVVADFTAWLERVQTMLAPADLKVTTWCVWGKSFWLPFFDKAPWTGHPSSPLWPLDLGPCLMEWSSAALHALGKNTINKTGVPRSLGLNSAFQAFAEQAPGLDWNLGGAGARALPQAVRAAQVLVCAEQVKIPTLPEPKSYEYIGDPYGGY